MTSQDPSAPRIYGFWSVLWRLLLAASLVSAACGAAGYFIAERLVQRPESQAPNLLTLPLEDALERSSTKGFPVLVEGRQATAALAPGHVLSQRPAPDQWVKSGSTIRVTLASGN